MREKERDRFFKKFYVRVNKSYFEELIGVPYLISDKHMKNCESYRMFIIIISLELVRS